MDKPTPITDEDVKLTRALVKDAPTDDLTKEIVTDLCNELDSRSETISSLQEQVEALKQPWQPIETCPKEHCEPVLLYAPAWSETEGSIHVGYFDAGFWFMGNIEVKDGELEDTAFIDEDDEPEPISPSHWMPLPAPMGEE